MLEQLFNNHFLYSLSLTLLHFLWQGLLVGFILKAVLLVIDQRKSTLRYGLATFSMLANLVIAAITFFIIYSDASHSINNSINPLPLNSLVNVLTQENSSLTYQSFVIYALPYLSIFWLATLIVMSGKLLIEMNNVNKLPNQATVPPSEELLARFAQLAHQIKLKKTPRLLISLKVDVPMAIGWLKPVVLLPASMVTGLDSAQLEMLLLHELAHIRRHDYLVNFFQTLIELLFFFHPCVHWIGKQMRNEREYCSDDVAVHHCGDAIAYAHTLTDTASLCAQKHCHTIPTMAMAASGGDLKTRVIRLVDHHCPPSNDKSKGLAALGLLFGLALIGGNQLLTSPLAFKLNKQFPWYETTPVMTSAEVEDFNIGTLPKNDLFPYIANNTIALQLLNSAQEEDLTRNILTPKNSSLSSKPLSIKIDGQNTTVKLKPSIMDSKQPTIPEKINEQITSNDYNAQSIVGVDSSNSKNKNDVKIAKITLAQNITKDSGNLPHNTSSAKKNQLSNNPLVSTEQPLKNAILKPVQDTTIASVQHENSVTPSDNAINNETNNTNSTNYQSTTLSGKQPIGNTQAYIDAIVKASANHTNNTKKEDNTYSQAIDDFEVNNTRYKTNYALENDSASSLNNNERFFPNENKSTISVLNAAKLLNSSNPVYPNLAKRRGLEMKVKVNFTVDRDGKVKDIDFGKQQNVIYFKSAIRTAIKKWRFTPATLNNDVIESKMSKIFSFSLQS